MYDVQEKKGKTQDWERQDKAYDRSTLSNDQEEIRATPQVNRILIRYMPENLIARLFYIIFSFVYVGRDRYGNANAVLKL